MSDGWKIFIAGLCVVLIYVLGICVVVGVSGFVILKLLQAFGVI